MKKIVIAQISIKEAQRNNFLALAKEMIKISNAEKGCIMYRLLEDIEQDNQFLFYEEYSNQQAVDHHNSSSHFHDFLNNITNMLNAAPVINTY